MKTYIQRFIRMVEDLKKQEQVQVLLFNIFPPATSAEIESVETALGYEIDTSIKQFYSQSNGLQLQWIFKSNEEYEPQKHVFETEKIVDWFHAFNDYFPEDGSIMILPIQKAFLQDWKEHIYFDWMKDSSAEQFAGKQYAQLDFSQRIKPFDTFNKYYDMAFFLDGSSNPPVIMGDDHQACYTDSRITDFASYLEFILANKGLVAQRNSFYSTYAGHKKDTLYTPQSYWTSENSLNIDQMKLKDIFPLSDQQGADASNLNPPLMQQMAKGNTPFTAESLATAIEEHHEFLRSGGAGGKWSTFSVAGLVLGIYRGKNGKSGKQIGFERGHLPASLDFQNAQIPFSNFCGVYAEKVDFTEADLSHGLFTDSMLKNCIFADTNLQECDFSRSDMRGTSFMNANLQNADFENCDLTGADFRGANLTNSRFPGAILKDVKY